MEGLDPKRRRIQRLLSSLLQEAKPQRLNAQLKNLKDLLTPLPADDDNASAAAAAAEGEELFYELAPLAAINHMISVAATIPYVDSSSEESSEVTLSPHNQLLDISSYLLPPKASEAGAALREALEQKGMMGYEKFASFIDPLTYAVIVVDPLTATCGVTMALTDMGLPESIAWSAFLQAFHPRSLEAWAVRLGCMTVTDIPADIDGAARSADIKRETLTATDSKADSLLGAYYCIAGSMWSKMSSIFQAALVESVAARTVDPQSHHADSASTMDSRVCSFPATVVEPAGRYPAVGLALVTECVNPTALWHGRWITRGAVTVPWSIVEAAVGAYRNNDAEASVAAASGDARDNQLLKLQVSIRVGYNEVGNCQVASDIPDVSVDGVEVPYPCPVGMLTVGDCSDEETVEAIQKYVGKWARRVLKQVELSEDAVRDTVHSSCNIELGDTVMKAIRRKLPITRQLFDFKAKATTRDAFQQRSTGPAAGMPPPMPPPPPMPR